MYTPLLILIIATPLLLLTIGGFVFINRVQKHYYAQTKYRNYNHIWHYTGNEYDIRHLPKEEQEMVKKSYGQYLKYSKIYDKTCYFFATLIVTLSFMVFLFGLLSAVGLLHANYEVREYSAMYDMITETLENSNELSTVGVASKVMEYNEWLTKARFSQEYWGSWSSYFYQDLSNLPYIIP